jgi:hypothetical protein
MVIKAFTTPMGVLFNSEQDIQWVKDVFGLTGDFKSVYLCGNEDAPTALYTYQKKNPLLTDDFTEIVLPTE